MKLRVALGVGLVIVPRYMCSCQNLDILNFTDGPMVDIEHFVVVFVGLPVNSSSNGISCSHKNGWRVRSWIQNPLGVCNYN